MSKARIIAHNKPAPAIRLSQRIAEESQLLAEEKWIIEALKKIKAQKNSLQIERLHLESMRTKIINNIEQSKQGSLAVKQVTPDREMPVASPTTEPPICTITNIGSCSQNNDELCNTEELNLSVTNSVFNTEQFGPTCDEEEEEEDMENCLLDMDLLMSGK